MKNNNVVVFIGIFVLGIIGGYYFFGGKTNSLPVEMAIVSTSTEVVKNVVSVVKPQVPTSPTGNYLKIAQRVTLSGVSVTPEKVTYDSRCPKDVQCIQAGTVEVGVLLQSGTITQNVIVTLGKPFYFDGTTVTLISVSPAKVSTKTLQPTDYRFLFNVKI